MEYPGITKIILDHYSSSERPLLLSQLGQDLKKAEQWPIPGEERTLAQVLTEITPPVEILKEGASGSYVLVAPPGYRHVAERALKNRRDVRYLRLVPRVVLIAFCVNELDRSVFIRSTEPYDYVIDSDFHDPNYILVDIKFRCPGLYVSSISDMSPESAADLANKIQQWSAENRVEFLHAKASKEGPKGGRAENEDRAGSRVHSGTALDRLYDAQKPEIAQGMNIPLDIAQLLSRLP